MLSTKIKSLCFWLCFFMAGYTHAALMIDSVVVIPSNCANSGTITTYAHSGSAMFFALVSGPDIRPPQSGNQFAGLPAGSYTLMVTTSQNDTAYANPYVSGNYQFPDFILTYHHPLCAGTATGLIVGNEQPGLGTPPYHWELTNLNTNVTISQSSDSFDLLPAGDYRLRQYDSCNSFATRSISLIDPHTAYSIGQIYNNMYSCDSNRLHFQIITPDLYLAEPITISLQTASGIINDTLPSQNYPPGYNMYYDFDYRYGNAHYGDVASFTITNACGQSTFIDNRISTFVTLTSFNPVVDSCALKFRPNLYLEPYLSTFNGSSSIYTNMSEPILLVIHDALTGTLIDSSFHNDSLGSAFAVFGKLAPQGRLYTYTISDTCGNSYSGTFTTPSQNPPSISKWVNIWHCRDSAASVDIQFTNYFFSAPYIELLSGPSYLYSSKPHYAFRDTIIYPIKKIYNQYGVGGVGGGDFIHGFWLSNLGVGTYHFRAYDSCGHSYSDSFTVTPQDVGDDHYQIKVKKGCPGENQIMLRLDAGGNFNPNSQIGTYRIDPIAGTGFVTYKTFQFYGSADSIFRDTIRNLNSGYYVLQLQYSHIGDFITAFDSVCPIIYDTIYIPPYQAPKISYATQIKCNGLVHVGLVADSTTGVPPYYYEILSGPQTSSVQAAPFFTLSLQGNYVARISDTCGFARTFSFFVDTLSFKQIIKIGSSCIGNTAILVSEPATNVTYIWQKPSGGIFIGDSLRLSPVTAADYGLYHIRKIVNINGCSDILATTYSLVSNTIDSVSASICNGNSISVGSHVYTATGIYRDTFATATCDSIHILNLTVNNYKFDSVSASICNGNSISVGSHVYTVTGIYRDTFATATCDSIHILNLTVNNYKFDSVAASICNGNSISVGSNVYTATGIYRDTFTTSTCDSIHILNLTVNNYKFDSVAASICNGNSISVGSQVYTATGIYRDTFATSTCDSIHILNLTVNNYKFDSVSASICNGNSISVGSHIYTATGIYRDTFATSTCDSIHILNLTVNNYKFDSVSASICNGNSISVGSHIYTLTGIYRDTFATSTCDSIHILNLTVNNYKFDSVSASLCNGNSISVGSHVYTATGIYRDTFATSTCDSIHILNLMVIPPNRDTLTVSFCTGDSFKFGNRFYFQSGVYSDTIATANCDSIHTLEIVLFTPAIAQIEPISIIHETGDTIILRGQGNGIFHWSSTLPITNPDIPITTATASSPAWVYLHVITADNCSATDSLFIPVSECNDVIYVPNAFSPNGDGANDTYRIYGRCIHLNRLMIFNRWGEKVWDTSDIEKGWDGFYKGELQPPGIFVYYLTYNSGNRPRGERHELKGSITLVR
ncbi:MAG: gliding motility-associated C-terminal domain-containing protein [Chitinophagales bacterium]